ncbi:MAG: DUF4935 domain-containing protein [Verrucomicrobia bacterium]|nr:DUF4935 domain-containing protein [Verrucomicrobiota bacterium]
MHIFIDANIFLGFYEATSDSLLELEKLITVLKQKKGAKLWLPDQVKREFWKNRDGSVASVLKEFSKLNGLGSIPRLVQEDPEFDQLKKVSVQLESKKKDIVDRVRSEVAAEKTKADGWIRSLFGLAEEIDTSGAIAKQAWERALRHTPPGKQDGLGDRLSWVALLTTLPQKSELHIISQDGDFAGELERDEIHPYLKCEWTKKNGGNVKLWKRASQFLAAHFPEAKNAIEIERTLLVERLEKSPNFATTHSVIAEFSDLTHLSHSLATRLASAILNNSQVHWIHDDEDVKKFITDFVAQYGPVIDAVMKSELEKLI